MKAHPIPEAALKKHIAILGMNGSGKTSVAKSQIIEPALAAGERVCNVDPTGVGWGLLNGGGFNNALSRLRTLELMTGRGDDLAASDNLFG